MINNILCLQRGSCFEFDLATPFPMELQPLRLTSRGERSQTTVYRLSGSMAIFFCSRYKVALLAATPNARAATVRIYSGCHNSIGFPSGSCRRVKLPTPG